MRKPSKEIKLASYEQILGMDHEQNVDRGNQIVEIELEKLYPFKNHPFHVNAVGGDFLRL